MARSSFQTTSFNCYLHCCSFKRPISEKGLTCDIQCTHTQEKQYSEILTAQKPGGQRPFENHQPQQDAQSRPCLPPGFHMCLPTSVWTSAPQRAEPSLLLADERGAWFLARSHMLQKKGLTKGRNGSCHFYTSTNWEHTLPPYFIVMEKSLLKHWRE